MESLCTQLRANFNPCMHAPVWEANIVRRDEIEKVSDPKHVTKVSIRSEHVRTRMEQLRWVVIPTEAL